eukprot:TRINITY_DN79988_c0_g1_i1.p1 TRINITY_DN79988_c0_g1~~TRINITY_DN79988_c0_g1_i1.p1  ORF type:complete len:706 (+),score=103.31 TRINITY_DN79988_c0_g1_i1:67-2184(+)
MAASVDVFHLPQYANLSNFATGYGFWRSEAGRARKVWWPSAEHFFQAGKFEDPQLQAEIRAVSLPDEAKGLGRRLSPMRQDWDNIKRARLRAGMLEKFWTHADARQLLLSIEPALKIVNGNPVDTFFGIGPDGRGRNVLGDVLEELRDFFLAYPSRRMLSVRVAGIGEPFEPYTLCVDVTGAHPDEVSGLAACCLGLDCNVLDRVELVTDGGFEKTDVLDLSDKAALDAYIHDNYTDICLEASLVDAALVTLWDGQRDSFLGRADVKHLCDDLEKLLRRFHELMPVSLYDCFSAELTFKVDESGDSVGRPVTAASLQEIVEAAAEMADVVITLHVQMPQVPVPPLLARPAEVESPHVRCFDHTALDEVTLVDKVRGLVWGAALGDAIGLCTEFMSKKQAEESYTEASKLGPASRVEDKHRARWAQGDWTDDTDQLVLLMDAIVTGGGVLDQKAFAEALKLWSNQGFPELGDKAGLGIGQTVHGVLDHEVYDVAPDIAADVIWRQSGCSMAANGAVMRCAAAALSCFWNDEVVRYNALAGSSVTHADPRCHASCLAVCSLLARLLTGVQTGEYQERQDEVAYAASTAMDYLSEGDRDELWDLMVRKPSGELDALRLDKDGIGYTYKPVAAAFWAFMHAESFKDAITKITMQAGDADSNAVVAGAVLGARLGFSALPPEWLAQVPELQTQWLDERITRTLKLMGLHG